MKISVDTKVDSPEHIHKVIELLQSMIDITTSQSVQSGAVIQTDTMPMDDVSTEDSTSQPEPPQMGIFNLFNDDPPEPNTEQSSQDSEEETDSPYTIKEEKMEPVEPEEIPQVTEYDVI